MDSFAANKRFAQDISVTFPLLSDWKHDVVKAYGLLDENSGYSARATFVIDKDGIIQFLPHLIDSDSGIGTQFVVDDFNGDKLLDIVVANKKGVFIFEQVRGQ